MGCEHSELAGRRTPCCTSVKVACDTDSIQKIDRDVGSNKSWLLTFGLSQDRICTLALLRVECIEFSKLPAFNLKFLLHLRIQGCAFFCQFGPEPVWARKYKGPNVPCIGLHRIRYSFSSCCNFFLMQWADNNAFWSFLRICT